VASHRAATSQGGACPEARLPPFVGASDIPAWVMSVMRTNAQTNGKRVVINCSMPCLKGLSDDLRLTLGADQVRVVRVSHLPCPCAFPRVHIHSSNGIYLAYDPTKPETAYIKCTCCRSQGDASAAPLGFLPLTEEGLCEIVAGAKALPAAGAKALPAAGAKALPAAGAKALPAAASSGAQKMG